MDKASPVINWNHGWYKLSKDGDILVIDAGGPFNEYIVRDYHKEIIEFTEQFENGFSMLARLERGSIFIPEALVELRKARRNLFEHGMKGGAYILEKEDVLWQILQQQIDHSNQNLPIQWKLFTDETAAREWLLKFPLNS